MNECSLHDQRLAFVTGLLRDGRAKRVLDLGCGAGRLLASLLVHPEFTHVTGMDSSASALAVGRAELPAEIAAGRLSLLHGDITAPHPGIDQADAIALVEVIEHMDPARLSATERTVFVHYRPALAVITTPNAEYNPLLGLMPGQWRDPDHRFEWPRGRFRAWAAGVGRRHGYSLQVGGIGDPHPVLGHPTQYALLRRQACAPQQ